MLGSLVQRVYWPVALLAALGLVFRASAAQAQNKNPGDPFSLGVLNAIDALQRSRAHATAASLVRRQLVHRTGPKWLKLT
jgi:hypothetical protein